MTTDPDYERRRADILDEKRNVTSRISDTCRYIGFGLLVAYYTIMSGDGAFAKAIASGYGQLALHTMAIVGAAAILFDYLQYFFGARAVQEALDDESARYNPSSCNYKARAFFYHAKQVSVFIGAFLLLVVVVRSSLPSATP